MTLIADAIKLSFSEKDLHKLNYPFKTIPAMSLRGAELRGILSGALFQQRLVR
jgi:hypothetical protein